MAASSATPGVSTQEANTYPDCVVPVATAVPAFIGYTPRADYRGKSFFNKPQKISSFADFQSFFMLEEPAPPAAPARQYSPAYYLVPLAAAPSAGISLRLADQVYGVVADPDTMYYMVNSIRLFYQNGGGDAYIVSVGGYGPRSKKPLADPGTPPVNANVRLSDLQRGLAMLANEREPTMYICPEATLLAVDDNATLMQSMLLQASTMRTAMCLFDIIGGAAPDPLTFTDDIERFRDGTGSIGVKYGVGYYPFIGTTVMQSTDIDFTNLFGGDTKQLANLINLACAPSAVAAKILALIQTPPASPLSDQQLHAALLTASPVYMQIVAHVLESANILPASGALAGVYTVVDSTSGVWASPANANIVGAASLPIRLADTQQENLNIDAVSGKSINAIRFVDGQGILAWGARTLDGNSDDWRYIPACRTLIYIEQSAKMIARAYMFEANTPNTWSAVKSMISSFLNELWTQGGVQGATPVEAFEVLVGLGSTMTADDVENGYMLVTIRAALIKPAEFVVLTFQQLAQPG